MRIKTAKEATTTRQPQKDSDASEASEEEEIEEDHALTFTLTKYVKIWWKFKETRSSRLH